jgi:hypothetical protein
MTKLKSGIAWVRAHILWFALAALPLVVAACNNGGSGGNGY